MKKKISIFLLIILVLNLSVACSSLNGGSDSTKNQDSASQEYILRCDSAGLVKQEKQKLTFTIEAEIGTNVSLCNDDESVIKEMLDNGQEDDLEKNDGIYTASIELIANDDSYSYTAKIGNVNSSKLELYSFGEPTRESVQTFYDSYKDFIDIDKSFRNTDGTFDEGRNHLALEAIKQKAKSLLEDGTLKVVEDNPENVVMQFDCGIWYAYDLFDPDTDGAGANINLDIYTFQPYKNYPIEEHRRDYEEVINCSSSIQDTFETASLIANLGDGMVSLEAINIFGPNQVILWHGHGNYSENIGPYIITGESTSFSNGFTDFLAELFYDKAWEEFVRGGVIFTGDGLKAVTAAYIDKHCQNMDNSFVYLAACSSGKTDRLMRAFLNKGVGYIIGNSDTIITLFNIAKMTYIIERMCSINEDTGNYYTAGEALRYSTRGREFCFESGKDIDFTAIYDDPETPAHPVRLGNDNYRFYDITLETEDSADVIADGTYTSCPSLSQETSFVDDFWGITVPAYYSVSIQNNMLYLEGALGIYDDNSFSYDIVYPYGSYEIPLASNFIIGDYHDGEFTENSSYITTLDAKHDYMAETKGGYGIDIVIVNGEVVRIECWGG